MVSNAGIPPWVDCPFFLPFHAGSTAAEEGQNKSLMFRWIFWYLGTQLKKICVVHGAWCMMQICAVWLVGLSALRLIATCRRHRCGWAPPHPACVALWLCAAPGQSFRMHRIVCTLNVGTELPYCDGFHFEAGCAETGRRGGHTIAGSGRIKSTAASCRVTCFP
jgi:hypothetical protein